MLLNLQPSRILSISLLLLHFGAAVCLFSSQMPWWLMIVGVMLVSCSGWHTLRRYALLNDAQAIVSCYLQNEGEWRVQYRNGQQRLGRLQGDSWRSRYLLLLRLKYIDDAAKADPGWCRWLSSRAGYMVVCMDALPKQTFRQLQAYLTLNATHCL